MKKLCTTRKLKNRLRKVNPGLLNHSKDVRRMVSRVCRAGNDILSGDYLIGQIALLVCLAQK